MSNSNTDQNHFPQYHPTTVNQSLNILPVPESSGKLKVEDALKYIDKVKSRFPEEIYKKFLEVMKDFKAQKINTEHVIHSVISLFNGHQDLIEGFNTFLPPGYQMCNYQIQNSTTYNHNNISSLTSNQSSLNTSYTIIPTSIKYSESSLNMNNNVQTESVNYVSKEKTDLNNSQHAQTSNAMNINLKAMSTMSQPPTEFNHAVEYVNKIKNRYQKQPDVYKRFLEVLHWYQKEQKNPDTTKKKETESEVYQEIAKLFNNEPDLLDEFSSFLPESTDELCQTRQPKLPQPNTTTNFKSQPYLFSASNSAALAGAGSISERNNKYANLQHHKLEHQQESVANNQDKDFSTDLFHHRSNVTNNLGATNTPTNVATSKRPLVQEPTNSNTSTTEPHERRLSLSTTTSLSSTVATNDNSNLPIGHPPNKRIRTSSSSNIKETIKQQILSNNSINSAIVTTQVNLLPLQENPKTKQHMTDIFMLLVQEVRDSNSSANCNSNEQNNKIYNQFFHSIDLYNKSIISIEDLKLMIKPFFSKKSENWLNFLNLINKVKDKEKITNVGENLKNSSSFSNYESRNNVSSSGSKGFIPDSNLASPTNSHQNRHHHHTNYPPYKHHSYSSSGTPSQKLTTPINQQIGVPQQQPLSSTSSSCSYSSSLMMFSRRNIELSKFELCGSHYRILPEEYTDKPSIIQQKSKLCKEVLNYHFLCHRSLSQFVFKKNQYEENVFKIEDDRYEIDMVMEVNKSAMVKLADIHMRLKEMKDPTNFNFDEALQNSSSVLFYKAIVRLYGDKANEIIKGLRAKPFVAVPIVLDRLREKDSEWKEQIKGFRRNWRQDQYLLMKSLDYQSISFRSRDSTHIRPKPLLNCLDAKVKQKPYYLNNYQDSTLFSKLIDSLLNTPRTWRKDRPEKWGSYAFSPNLNHTLAATNNNHNNNHNNNNSTLNLPNMPISNLNGVVEMPNNTNLLVDYHLMLLLPCDVKYAKSIIDVPFQPKLYDFDKLSWYDLLSDASSFIIHHLKRQTNFNKEDKTNMKNMMRQTIQDLFIDERFPMSDDEDNDDDTNSNGNNNNTKENIPTSNNINNIDKSKNTIDPTYMHSNQPKSAKINSTNNKSHSQYKFILGSRNWYVFLRLYHILIDRLAAFKVKSEQLFSIHKEERNKSSQEVADLLLYKKSNPITPENYYSEAIGLVKDLLDSYVDPVNFEDKMREMFGINAYIWFSIDKLIMAIVKQLHTITCTDEYSQKLTSLFRQCTRQFYGKDECGNVLNIKRCGTGSYQNQRNTNLDIISDEYAYLEAASRYSISHQEPLLLLLFQRQPTGRNMDQGILTITMLDNNSNDDGNDDDDDDENDENDDDDDEEEEDDIDDDEDIDDDCNDDDNDDGDDEGCDDDDENGHGQNKQESNIATKQRKQKTVPTNLQSPVKVEKESASQRISNTSNICSEKREHSTQKSSRSSSEMIGWRRYIGRYIKYQEEHENAANLSSISHNINVNQNNNQNSTNFDFVKRIGVPVFLVRALSNNLKCISSIPLLSAVKHEIDDGIVMEQPDIQDERMEIVEDTNDNGKDSKISDMNEEICESKSESTKNDLEMEKEVSLTLSSLSTKGNAFTQGHNAIVSCITNTFPETNKERISTYLKNTHVTGHMCPTFEEGQNLIAQYATNKICWSVGSNSIFYHKKSPQRIKFNRDRSKEVAELRCEKFKKFNEAWLSKQKENL